MALSAAVSRIFPPPGFTNEGSLFLAHPDGTIEPIVLIGQEITVQTDGGSMTATVQKVELSGAGRFGVEKPKFGGMKSLNESGNVAFWAEVDIEGETRDGIFLWAPPPPPPPPPSVDSVEITGDSILFSIKTETGKLYQLQRREDLNAQDWQAEGSSVEGTGDVIVLRHDNAHNTYDRQFYRVLITDV